MSREEWPTRPSTQADGGRTRVVHSEETTATVAGRLFTNVVNLLREYGALGGHEGKHALRDGVWGLVMLGAAAMVGLYVIGLLFTTMTLALSLVVAAWLAALIVLAFAALLMAVLIVLGIKRLKFERVGKVIHQVRKDVRWLRNEIIGST